MSPRRSVQLIAVAMGALTFGGHGAAATVKPPPTAVAKGPQPGLPDAHGVGGIRLFREGKFAFPVDVTGPPGDRHRLFVLERAGVIRIVRDTRTLSRPFYDFHKDVGSGGERGALSIAFSPDWGKSGIVYFAYTARNGDGHIESVRHSATNPDVADRRTRRVVRIQHHPAANHNGGDLMFGPDGDLYMGTGDGGSNGDPFHNGQNLGSGLGKMIRIQPHPYASPPYGVGNYSIPPDNPFVKRPGSDPAVYFYGFRNPWRWSFDRLTGDFLIGDVGQETWEEVDFYRHGAPAGANFGWGRCEGDHVFPPAKQVDRTGPCRLKGAVAPALVHLHSRTDCAIIGGFVVRDPTLTSLYGRYVYSDLCNPTPRSVVIGPTGASDDRPLPLSIPGIVSFGEDAFGCIYATAASGAVYRIAPAAAGAPCPGTAPASAPISHPPRDRHAPRAQVSLIGDQEGLDGRGIRLSARCDEPCRTTVTGTLRAVDPRAKTVALRAITVSERAAAIARVVIPVPRRKTALERAVASLRIAVSDRTGNTIHLQRRVSLH